MGKKTVHQILNEATPEQIRVWWKVFSQEDGRWPETMPLPAEAFSTVWHSLQQKFIALPQEKTDAKV